MKGRITFKGGSGSGNFGHSGRPGHVGGSGGGSGGNAGGGSVVSTIRKLGVELDKTDLSDGRIKYTGSSLIDAKQNPLKDFVSGLRQAGYEKTGSWKEGTREWSKYTTGDNQVSVMKPVYDSRLGRSQYKIAAVIIE